MRRASRVYLTYANVGKVAALRSFLLLYVNVVNYFTERFWTMKDFTPARPDSDDRQAPGLGDESQAVKPYRRFAVRLLALLRFIILPAIAAVAAWGYGSFFRSRLEVARPILRCSSKLTGVCFDINVRAWFAKRTANHAPLICEAPNPHI